MSMEGFHRTYGRWTRLGCSHVHRRFRTRVHFAVSGGLVQESGVNELRVIADLMWSDPEDIENWAMSPRGAGWLFGGNVAKEASHVINRIVIDAHS